MENNIQEANTQSPEINTTADVKLVDLDLNKLIAEMKAGDAWEKTGHHALTLLKSSSMRIVLVGLHEGAELKTHTAPGDISVQALSGHIHFSAEEKVISLQPLQMLALKKDTPHSVRAEKESFFLLTIAIAEK
ncbi:MAG: hypothetical protein JWQ27_3196 [Ferruginibacter sp.]|nr:hypothetical protein [Ferruginibacter sp.]